MGRAHWGTWRWAVLTACVLAAPLAACNGKSRGTKDTLPPEPPTTTTTAPAIDVTKVPTTIDIPYVQAVMDKLDPVIGDAIRLLATKKVPTPEFVQLLDAVYGPSQSRKEQQSYGTFIARDPPALRADAGNPETKVLRIIDSSRTCIVVEATRDYGPVFVHAPESRDTDAVVQLRPKDASRDPQDVNRTAWAILGEGFAKSATVPEHPCG